MSLVFAALIQLVPVPAAHTPVSKTVPVYEVSCMLTDMGGARRAVTLVQTGGRGYRDDRPNRPGFAVQRTDFRVGVGKDETGFLKGYEFIGRSMSDDQARWTGVRQFQRGRMTTQIESFMTLDPRRIAIIVKPRWPLGAVAAMGFCDLKITPQQPLSAAETENWLAR